MMMMMMMTIEITKASTTCNKILKMKLNSYSIFALISKIKQYVRISYSTLLTPKITVIKFFLKLCKM